MLLLLLTRLLGKKQLGQLTIFTYITGIALGNMAGDMIIHKDTGGKISVQKKSQKQPLTPGDLNLPTQYTCC